MPILFACPHCKTETDVDECYVGQTGPCVVCGKPVTVPHPDGWSGGPLAHPPAEGYAPVGTSQVVTGPPAGGPGRSSTSKRVALVILTAVAGMLVMLVVSGFLIALMLPAIRRARITAQQTQCRGNLRTIAMALQQYEAEHGVYPPAYIPDANGKPMHSWRVLILPQLGRRDVYNMYNFNEPWDSTNNMNVTPYMPEVFACPTDVDGRLSKETNYMVLLGAGTLFPPPGETVSRDDVIDGLSETIAVIEVSGRAVGWTEPVDLTVSSTQLLLGGSSGLGGLHPGGALIATADGQVHFVLDGTSPQLLRALGTRAGGEFIPWTEIEK